METDSTDSDSERENWADEFSDEMYLLRPVGADQTPSWVTGNFGEVLKGKVHALKLMVESGMSVNEGHSRWVLPPLQMAAIADNLDVLGYLLSRDGISVNAQSRNRLTPLHLAARLGHIEVARMLIQAGADVNIRDSKHETPLHEAVCYPELAHLLVQKGADVDAVCSRNVTPLYAAVRASALETVCMLLYYNADADVRNTYGYTPFVLALILGNSEIQQALFEYVADFKKSAVLHRALSSKSRFVGDILKRGADVNYTDRCCGSPSILAAACKICCSQDMFKLIWDELRYDKRTSKFSMLELFEADGDSVEGYLQVIIESDNFAPAVKSLTAKRNYSSFVAKFADYKMKLEQLTTFTCRLLQYGYRATSLDIGRIFAYYGFCELLRILLYMDVDCTEGWAPSDVIPRMMVDLDYKLEETDEMIVLSLECITVANVIDAPVQGFGEDEKRRVLKLIDVPEYGFGERRVPSLIKLARDVGRLYIWNSLRVKSTCQFYTAIDNLMIPSAHKKILTLETKLYDVLEPRMPF